MTPEAARFLVKANGLIERATTMLSVRLYEDAGRNAYLAGFHAAQAHIFEIAGKVVKTHKGVQTEFLRLTKGDPQFAAEHKSFLSRRYDLKATADYDAEAIFEVTEEIATTAVAEARRFVSFIAASLDATRASS